MVNIQPNYSNVISALKTTKGYNDSDISNKLLAKIAQDANITDFKNLSTKQIEEAVQGVPAKSDSNPLTAY